MGAHMKGPKETPMVEASFARMQAAEVAEAALPKPWIPPIVQRGHMLVLGDDEHAAAMHGDAHARRELLALLTWDDAGAPELARLFEAVAEALGASNARISPDAGREYRELVRRVRRAVEHHVTKSSTAQKRARVYLEERILHAAEKCGANPAKAALAASARDVIALTSLDAFSCWLVDALREHEAEIVACVRAANLRNPRGGQFSPPGRGVRNGARVRAYEDAFKALCRAIGVAPAAPETRVSARSRAKSRGE
jgi:hypothetical protein